MILKNTIKYIKWSKALSVKMKALSIFLLCFFNFHSAQIYTSDKDALHITGMAQIVEANNSDQATESKIYITHGASVLDLEKSNFKIVKVKNSKKQITSNTKIIKSSKLQPAVTEHEKQNVAQTLPKKVENYTSLPDSGHSVSLQQYHKTISAQTQTFNLKALMKIGYKYQHLSVLALSKAKIAAYFSYYNSSIYLSAASIRPPPVIL